MNKQSESSLKLIKPTDIIVPIRRTIKFQSYKDMVDAAKLDANKAIPSHVIQR